MDSPQPVVTPISDEFLRALVAELTGPDTVAIILAGSYAHGDATPCSDVDIGHLVSAAHPGPDRVYHYRGGRLVSVATRPLDWYRRATARPQSAIFYVVPLREARVLFDPDGAFCAFQRELARFSWTALQDAANAYASGALTHLAEVAHKALSALARGNMYSLFEASTGLVLGLTQVVAIQRGVLVESSRTYMQQVQATAGADSAWTRFHRLALDPDAQQASTRARALASLRLYQETLTLLRPALHAEQRALVEQAVAVIDAALEHLRSGATSECIP